MQFYKFLNGDAKPFNIAEVRDVLTAYNVKNMGQTSCELQVGELVQAEEFEIRSDDFEFPVFLNSFNKDGTLTYNSVTTDGAVYVGNQFPDLCYRLICTLGLTGFYPEGDWVPLIANDGMANELPTAFPPYVVVRSADDVKRALGLE